MSAPGRIHSSAIVAEDAQVHESVAIGPFSIIESGAVIGAGCRIESGVRIFEGTRLGRDNVVCDGAKLGAEPQDLAWAPGMGGPLTVGDENHFKEHVHISRGAKTEEGTVIGDRNYAMGAFHAGHDCRIGDDNILGHGSVLAGHVQVEDRTFISGLVAIHQFCRVGTGAMVGGGSAANQDIPPYSMARGSVAALVGPNVVGLRRAAVTAERRAAIKRAYATIYRSSLKLAEALDQLDDEGATPEVRHIVEFARASTRGLVSHR
jgi:UDP-N-acetylglucosamine acyltransferase